MNEIAERINNPVLLNHREKAMRRELIRQTRAQIPNHAALEQILRRIPDDAKRRQFFESVKPFLKFKVEWGAAPQATEEATNGSDDFKDKQRSDPGDDRQQEASDRSEELPSALRLV